MKKITAVLLTLILLSFIFSSCGNNVSVDIPAESTAAFTDVSGNYTGFKADSIGYYIYQPYQHVKWGYRYGPSILENEDGSLDAYFAAPGSMGQADFITYKHSPDGGITWGNEKSVLQPTPGSPDLFSCCDPGVIYFGGYYYLGYTSTVDSSNGGLDNDGFVARSENPDGPFEKWNGKGWGGVPSPIVENPSISSDWGVGELSFAIKDNTLFVYYTLRSYSGQYMMVCQTDVNDENWPASLSSPREAIDLYSVESGVDVKYDPAKDKFLAVAVVNSFTADSSFHFYLSDDGINFTENCISYDNFHKYAHNVGLVYSPGGTINIDKFFLTYAFGEEWGRWATLMTPISSFESDHLILDGTSYGGDVDAQIIGDNNYVVAITTNPHHLNLTKGMTDKLTVHRVYVDFKTDTVSYTDGVEYTGYDQDIIEINPDGNITGKSIGNTYITVNYEGHSCSTLISVYKEGTDLTSVRSKYGD